MQTQKPKSYRVSADRAFRLVSRDENGPTGVRVIKPEESIVVSSELAAELIGSGKAHLAAEPPRAEPPRKAA